MPGDCKESPWPALAGGEGCSARTAEWKVTIYIPAHLKGKCRLSIMESEKRHKGGIPHAEEKALPVPG